MSAHKPWARMPEGEGVELALFEQRQVGPCSGFSLGEEDRGELLHQAIPRALPGAETLALAKRSNSQGVGFTPYSAHRTRSENAFEISSGVKVQWP